MIAADCLLVPNVSQHLWRTGVLCGLNSGLFPTERAFCVSICTFVPVKQVNWVPAEACAHDSLAAFFELFLHLLERLDKP